jgi:hypothetical protein
VAALLPSLAPTASAGRITAFGGASGPGLASMSFNNFGTPAPANDDTAGASENWLSVNQKDYDNAAFIDMVFTVADSASGTTTEYIFTEGVNNGTGVPWTDYHIELGFGTGAGFVRSGPGDGLDFDAPDYNSPYDFSPFATLTIAEDTIDAVDGLVPAGAFNVFAFPIDVPDGITEFTIRQYPTTEPVPATPATWGRIKMLLQ